MRRALDAAATPRAFALLGLVLVALLAFGSVHRPPASAAARIAALESVIKCPSCADVSIAQSDAPVAGQLRASVTAWVDAGRSNAWIEDAVVARYGPGILLRPRNLWLFVVPALAIAAALAALGATLWRRRSAAPPSGDATVLAEDEALVAAALVRHATAWPPDLDEGVGR